MTKLHQITGQLKRLYRDERGAEGLEKILIIGAIVLPLLGILYIFRGKITEMLGGAWNTVQDDAGTADSADADTRGNF